MTPSFVIKELSLSGNQLAQDNEAYKAKYRWIGDDDKSRPKVELAKDKNGMSGVALDPQRIRVFEISYGQKTSGTQILKLKHQKLAQITSKFTNTHK